MIGGVIGAGSGDCGLMNSLVGECFVIFKT